MDVYLIRHGKTKGNLEHRYIGTTDESLCKEGIEELQSRVEKQYYPSKLEALAVSPMKRCKETAKLLFPELEQEIVSDLRETDFGLFENKNYPELSTDPYYQKWLDSQGTLPFPDGENREDFRLRCVNAFRDLIARWQEKGISTAAVVAHGGTIMAIVSGMTQSEFYDWQLKNGEYLYLSLNDGTINSIEKA